MAESRIKDENYYQISGFMVNRLGLKGVALSVYAIIYGFTQDGENEFTGSLQYLCDFCGGVSKPTIINALKDLVKRGYIIRREEVINNVQFNRYKVNLPLLKNFNGGVQNSNNGVVKNSKRGSKETLHNNISDNNSFNNKDINNNAQNDFETLWELYPRKVGKQKAFKAFQKAIKNGVSYETIKSGIEAYNRHIAATNTKPEFIKHGATWFNGECWHDEYKSASSQQQNNNFVPTGGVNI